MQQRLVKSQGKTYLVNCPGGGDDFGIGPGFAIGQLVMKSYTDNLWHVICCSGSVGSVVAYVSQSALPFTSGPIYTQNEYTASIVGYMDFFEQNWPCQIVASTDGNAYQVYLTGTAPTAQIVVSQSVWGKAYITNSRNAIIDMAKPNLYLQSVTDGNFYVFYLSTSGGVTSLVCDQGAPPIPSGSIRIDELGNIRVIETGDSRITG